MSYLTIYTSRRDSKYLSSLQEIFAIENLMERALAPPKGDTWQVGCYSFRKRCTISFLGISANTFFDRNGAFLRDGKPTLYSQLEEVFRKHREFKKNGIWLRVRFLFVYPYSTHAMSIINAETTIRRTSMAKEDVHPTAQLDQQVDEDRFKGSSLFQSQRNALKTIQRWVNAYQWKSERGNSVAVRFTSISPNLCALLVNDTAFCDSYLLAKKDRLSDRLEFSSPLFQINLGEEGGDTAFRSMEDHFRYLWQSNVTLDCRDATDYRQEPNYQGVKEYQGLQRVRPPDKISFDFKAHRLSLAGRIAQSMQERWALAAYEQFLRYVTLPQESIRSRTIFISCSWEEEGLLSRPHRVARYLREWIRKDITSYEAGIQAELMQGNPGEALPGKLFHLLNRSSLAIFLLTGDLSDRGNKFSRPNVYHELGYLMARMQPVQSPFSQENRRLFIAREDGVALASNIAHLVHEEIKSPEFLKKYIDTSLPEDEVEEAVAEWQALGIYVQVLAWLHRHKLSSDVFDNAKNRLADRISKINSAEVKKMFEKSFRDMLKELQEESQSERANEDYAL